MLTQSNRRTESSSCKKISHIFSGLFSWVPDLSYFIKSTRDEIVPRHEDEDKDEELGIVVLDRKTLVENITITNLPEALCELIAAYAKEPKICSTELEATIERDIEPVEKAKSLLPLALGYSERRIRLSYGVDSRTIANYPEFLQTVSREEKEIKNIFSGTAKIRTLKNVTIQYCRELYSLRSSQEREREDAEREYELEREREVDSDMAHRHGVTRYTNSY